MYFSCIAYHHLGNHRYLATLQVGERGVRAVFNLGKHCDLFAVSDNDKKLAQN